jgi:hypothetical protein
MFTSNLRWRGLIVISLACLALLGGLGALLGTGVGGSAPQTTDTFTAVADSYVSQGSPAQNYGADTQLVVGYEAANHRRSLLRFDISGIPAGQIITNATLRAYVMDISEGGATVDLRRIDASWNEGAVTWSASPAVWPPAIASGVVSAAGWATWDLTGQVRAWYKGLDANYGVELGGPAAGDYTIHFSSREGIHPPELVVSYGLANLVITDLWPGETQQGGVAFAQYAATAPDTTSYVCCQIRNIGEVAAPAGFRLGVSTDGGGSWESATQTLPLPVLGRLSYCFESTPWTCSGDSDTVVVCADTGGVVPETNEDDNCRQEVWPCDTQAPSILQEPAVSSVTSDSATITWDTDEPSSGRVRYGRTSSLYDSAGDDTFTSGHHQVLLSALQPAAVYHFQVASADAAGNEVASGDAVFETLPVADSTPPTVSFPDPGVVTGTVTLRADATDNIGVEKVEFYVDGALLETDYTAPFEMTLEGSSFPNGDHLAQAVAYDLAGGSDTADQDIDVDCVLLDNRDPTVTLQSPEDGETVERGPVTISVFAIDQKPDDIAMYQVNRVEFYVNGHHKETVYDPDSGYTYSYTWRTGGLAEGEYTILVKAYDGRDNSDSDSITVYVPEETTPTDEPVLEITRLTLEREDAHYKTGILIENLSARTVHIERVEDEHVGFQPRYVESSDLSYDFEPSTATGTVVWDGSRALAGKSTTQFEWKLVPILGETDIDYQIGSATNVRYEDWNDESHLEALTIPETESLQVSDRIDNADYLIMTYPENLFTLYSDNGVNSLLAWMASLAVRRNGVLGYLESNHTSAEVRDLLQASGDWGKQLTSGWPSGGHVLIVGNTGIVPSQTIYDEDIEDALGVHSVELSDNWHADLSGSDAIPELAIGRIIGDNTDNLIATLTAGLASEFSCERALLVTGIGSGHSSFWWNTDAMQDRLEDVFSTVHWLDWENYATADERLSELRADVPDRDLLIFRGHGNPTEWYDGLQQNDLPLDFGDSRPLVIALACETGNYNDGRLAVRFLDSGAGAYIGATEISERYTNNDAGKDFTDRWPNGMNSGMALKQTKTAILEDDPDDYHRLWAMEYNLYGDPKFGYCPGTAAAALAAAPSSPPSTVDVTIPDYVVTSVEGEDVVTIPGGAQLAVEGQPLVPYYVVTYDYAEGYEVQDVVLTARTGLTTTTGLNLPTVVHAIDGLEASPQPTPPPPPEGWYPPRDYAWATHPNANGSSTLVIRIYPFYYNPLTTDVRFYQNYSFEVHHTTSSVQILDVKPDKPAYVPGETLTANITVASLGPAQDVVAMAAILHYGSGKIVKGLLLQSLNGLTGKATFTVHWDTTGALRGRYAVEVMLKDASGHLLDRQTADFDVGITSGAITAFSATPKFFSTGQPIHAVLTFKNTGSLPVVGSAQIIVRNEAGSVMKGFSQPITNLPPGQSQSLDASWDTTGAALGRYRVIGWVEFEGQSTDPKVVVVSNEWPKTYLPLVLKM